jgi:hypothetical protein
VPHIVSLLITKWLDEFLMMNSDEVSGLFNPHILSGIRTFFKLRLQETMIDQLQSDPIGAIDFGLHPHDLAKGRKTRGTFLDQRSCRHTHNHEHCLTWLHLALRAQVHPARTHVRQYSPRLEADSIRQMTANRRRVGACNAWFASTFNRRLRLSSIMQGP